MGVLDLGRHPRAARWRRCCRRSDSPAYSQARRSRSWARASRATGGPSCGVLLDQREGLQHRVVQVRGDVGALLGADPLRPLVGQVGGEPEDPRADDDAEPDDGEQRRRP